MIWSISDSKTFRRCQRQWFYKSIAGNAKAADPVRHRLYLLSKLQSISAWRGQIVDSVISDVLIPAVVSKRRITLDQMKGHARLLFDRQLACATKHELFSPGFVPSRLGPEFAALHCMEYGTGIPEVEIKTARDEVDQALTNLFGMTEFKEILKSATALIPQRPLVFSHSGISVRAVPDLIVFSKDSPPVIVDWKVHFFGIDEAWLQLATYAMALTRCNPHRDFPDIRKWSVQEIELAEVQLLKNHVRKYSIGEDELDRAEAYIAESATEMGLTVGGRKACQLSAEDFCVARYEGACQSCNFRNVCWGGTA